MRSLVIALLLLVACASTSERPLTTEEICEHERTGELAWTQINPDYPREAYAAKVTGWVLMEGSVGPDGDVVDPRVIDSEPAGVFDKNALAAFDLWRYCPTSGEGQPRIVKTKLVFDLPR